jgi:hypothetical protein
MLENLSYTSVGDLICVKQEIPLWLMGCGVSENDVRTGAALLHLALVINFNSSQRKTLAEPDTSRHGGGYEGENLRGGEGRRRGR